MSTPEMVEFIKSMPMVSFENEHGEKFNISSNGLTAFISGDEVNAMVDRTATIGGFIPLFNQAFNIWSKDELYRLGKALMELNR
jgi:hypothetical protein